MSKIEEIAELVQEFQESDDISMQHHLLRSIGLKCVLSGVDARAFFVATRTEPQAEYGVAKCPDCKQEFKNNHALRAHRGRMHKKEKI
jgi:hypothetical protein